MADIEDDSHKSFLSARDMEVVTTGFEDFLLHVEKELNDLVTGVRVRHHARKMNLRESVSCSVHKPRSRDGMKSTSGSMSAKES